MRQPHGFEKSGRGALVCKLGQALYDTFQEKLEAIGF
jgi:hypothetical protein